MSLAPTELMGRTSAEKAAATMPLGLRAARQGRVVCINRSRILPQASRHTAVA